MNALFCIYTCVLVVHDDSKSKLKCHIYYVVIMKGQMSMKSESVQRNPRHARCTRTVKIMTIMNISIIQSTDINDLPKIQKSSHPYSVAMSVLKHEL